MSQVVVIFTLIKYVNGIPVSRTEHRVTLNGRMNIEFPIQTSERGSAPEESSVVRMMVQQMNSESFPTLNTYDSGRAFVSGHLRSQAYGGQGNDQNLIPMTRSLNTLYHNRFESLIKELRKEFPHSRAKIMLKFRLYFTTIKSQTGTEYYYVERIRVNVSLSDATEAELKHFDRRFRQNPDYRARTQSDQVTIQFSNDGMAEVGDWDFSSQTNEEEPSSESSIVDTVKGWLGWN